MIVNTYRTPSIEYLILVEGSVLLRDYGKLGQYRLVAFQGAGPLVHHTADFLHSQTQGVTAVGIGSPGQGKLFHRIQLLGLMDGSRQGDSVARYLFSLLGIKTSFGTEEMGVPTTVSLRYHTRSLPRLDFNFVNQPDLTQTYVVACALMGIPFNFTGVSTLRIKETDRIEALKAEMLKLGFVLKSSGDNSLSWNGKRCEAQPDPIIDTYQDHRMALAFTPAAFMFPGLRINDPMVVTKSYPNYWEDLRKAGFLIEEEP